MKRVFVLLLSILLVLLTGCSGAAPSEKFLSTLPWSPPPLLSPAGEETCTYSITRYAGSVESGSIITTDQSQLTYTLKEDYSFELDENQTPTITPNKGTTLLETKLQVYYNDSSDVPRLLKGESESIYSLTVFNRYSLAPILTYRNAQTVESPHTLTVDYSAKSATLTENSSTKSLSIKSGGYDTELLYYLIRALNNLKEGGSETLPLIIAYDDFQYDKGNIKSKDIIQSTSADLIDLPVPSSIYDKFFPLAPQDDDYKLSCYQTSTALNTAKSGPATKLYYAKQPTLTGNSVTYEAKNVLIKMETYLYGYLSGSLALDYTQVFNLTSYSNK